MKKYDHIQMIIVSMNNQSNNNPVLQKCTNKVLNYFSIKITNPNSIKSKFLKIH